MALSSPGVIVICIVIIACHYFTSWNTLDKYKLNNNINNHHDDLVIKKDASAADGLDLDPISEYIRNIDLTKVPPKRSPPNLPAARATEEETKGFGHIRTHHGYGGGGDKAHLGGFTTIDPAGISPYLWREMMEYFGVKTLLDVGCGRGFSTSWFLMQGVQVQCVEGSHDAIERSLLPSLSIAEEEGGKKEKGGNNNIRTLINSTNIIVEHDFSLGPWWPADTVDAIWCVELLEHVGRNFQKNYLTAFKKSALIFATHSNWGGWHHTEVHDELWWRSRFEMYGFVYSEGLTKRARQVVEKEQKERIPFPVSNTSHQYYLAGHIITTLQVFINPLVASRPEHAHVLSEPGCYVDGLGQNRQNAHCGEEPNSNSRAVNTKIPDEFKFIPYKEEKHKEWEEYVKKTVKEDRERQSAAQK